MSTGPNHPSPEQLALLSRVIRELTRSRHMSPEDADDFSQSVHLKLIERGYHVFHSFGGRSSLRTYLTVVVRRMLLDWQISLYGRWRPTVAAMELGQAAVDLERLINRDRYSSDEAIEIMRRRTNAPDVVRLRRTVERLPARQPRRRVSVETLEHAGVEFADPLAARDRQKAQTRIRTTMAAALAQLPSADRRLIALRYRRQRSVRALAQLLRTDPSALYRRFDRVLGSLRRSMAARGVTRATVADAR